MKQRRAECPDCKRSISVNSNGRLRLHGGPRDLYNPRYCEGSEKRVLEDRTPLERGVIK